MNRRLFSILLAALLIIQTATPVLALDASLQEADSSVIANENTASDITSDVPDTAPDVALSDVTDNEDIATEAITSVDLSSEEAAPSEDLPSEDLPTEEETTAEEPLTESAPTEEALPTKDLPTEETPAEEPNAENPSTEDLPTEEEPTEEAPSTEDLPTEDAPTEDTPTTENPPLTPTDDDTTDPTATTYTSGPWTYTLTEIPSTDTTPAHYEACILSWTDPNTPTDENPDLTPTTNLVIPNTLDGYPVSDLDTSLFESNSALVTVQLPRTLRYIGDYAFASCTLLEQVTFESLELDDQGNETGEYVLEYVDSYAFVSCPKLQSFTFPDSAETITLGTNIFRNDTDLAAVTLGSSINLIPGYTFAGCTSLETLSINTNANLTGAYVFQNVSLKTLILGNAVTSASLSFYTASTLTSIEVSPDNSTFTSFDGVLYDKAVTTLLRYPSARPSDSFIIPDTVTAVSSDAFYNTSALTAVTFPDSVTSLSRNTFNNCPSLESVDLGGGITSLAFAAFNNCQHLTTLRFNANISSITAATFTGAPITNVYVGPNVTSFSTYLLEFTTLANLYVDENNVTFHTLNGILYNASYTKLHRCPAAATVGDVVIPDTVTSITAGAFKDCTGVTSVVIPDSVTTMNAKIFFNCTSLTTVSLGYGITDVGEQAFRNCTSLDNIILNGNITYFSSAQYANTYPTTLSIGPRVTSIDESYLTLNSLTQYVLDPANTTYSLHDGILYSADGYTLISCPRSFPATTITLPDHALTIGERAFTRCVNLTEVIFPSTLNKIGGGAFEDCTNLTGIDIPEGVETIGAYAFEGDTRISSVKLPQHLTELGVYAFMGCTNLKTIEVDCDLSSFNTNAFTSVTPETLILGPHAAGVDSFFILSDIVNVIVSPESANYVLDGDFLMTADRTKLVYLVSDENVTSVTFPDTVTSIAEQAFAGNDYLTEVVIPSQIISIGEQAFYECGSLTALTLGTGITSIPNLLVQSCPALTRLTIEGNVTDCHRTYYSECPLYTTLCLGAQVNTVPWELLNTGTLTTFEVSPDNTTYTALDGVLYSADMTTLVRYPFVRYDYDETALLASFTIPESVTTIAPRAFLSNTQINRVYLPAGLTRVGSEAFYNQYNIMLMGTPDRLTYVGEKAFYGCSYLTGVLTFADGAYIGSNAFDRCEGITGVTYIGKNAPQDPDLNTGAASDPALSAAETNDTTEPATIGSYAFQNCTGLVQMEFLGDAPAISTNTFNNVSADLTYTPGYEGWGDFLTNISGTGIRAREVGECERAIALVVDLSSTSGEPLAAIRDAVTQFCNTMLTDGVPTQIAIIGYYSKISAYGFTSDKDLLASWAADYTDGNRINLYEAISRADSCLDAITASEKDLIILTNGVPNSGERSNSGPFTSSDHSSYQYGNACVTRFNALPTTYRVFTLGFFHSLTGSTKDYAASLLGMLQNSGYFEVTTGEALAATLSGITQSLFKPLTVTMTEEMLFQENDLGEVIPLFEVTVTVENENTIPYTGVTVKLDLDSPAVADTASGLTARTGPEIYMGDFAPGFGVTDTWQIVAPSLTYAKDYTYGFIVTATNALASEAFRTTSIPATLTPPPATPAAPKLTNAVSGVTVKWTAVDTADTYLLEKRTGSGAWTELTSTGALSYVDKAATTNGTRYQYRLTAMAGNAASGKSSVATIYRLARGKITAAANKSTTTAQFKWSKNAKSTGYQVAYSTSKKFTTATTKTKTFTKNTNLYWNVTGLKNGTTYYVRVRARKVVSGKTYYGAWSPTVIFVKLNNVTLSAARPTAGRKITVTWKRNAKATGYQIQYSTSSKFTGSTTKSVKITKNTTVRKVLTGLAKKTYYVRIRAYKTVSGKTVYSAWSTVKKAVVTS